MDCEFYKVSRVKEVEFKLPERSTANSAGYDFYAIEDIIVRPMSDSSTKPYCIKTGVKAFMAADMCLQLYPRSSWPSKLGLVMANSVGIIDSDYFDNEDNEGEIGFLVYNLTRSDITIKKGERLGQGIFTKFYLTDSDDARGTRIGGFGSTGV